MKKEYEMPEYEIYLFEYENVITTSYGDNEIEGDQWDTEILGV